MTIFIVCGNHYDPEDRDRTVSTEDNIVRVREQQVPIYCIRAETWNECMTTFNRIEGLEEYKPFPENEWTPTAPQAPARTTPEPPPPVPKKRKKRMTDYGRRMLLSVSGLSILCAAQLIQGFASHVNHNAWEPFHWIFAGLIFLFYVWTFIAAWKTREEVPEE